MKNLDNKLNSLETATRLSESAVQEQTESKQPLELPKEMPAPTHDFDLEHIKIFMEEFIGSVITQFKRFKEDVSDIESELSATIVTSISVDNSKLKIELASLSGVPVGNAVIEVSLSGQFAERAAEENELVNSRYRLEFFGGHCVEYIDANDCGNIYFNKR